MELAKKCGRFAAAVIAVAAILSIETGVSAVKVAVMAAGLAWLGLGVVADARI